MKNLSLTHQHRRSTKTLRINYGLEGMKYVIQIYEGEINGQGEKKGLLAKCLYKFDQKLWKFVHDLKNKIRENGWFQRDLPEVSQTSFLRILNQSWVSKPKQP